MTHTEEAGGLGGKGKDVAKENDKPVETHNANEAKRKENGKEPKKEEQKFSNPNTPRHEHKFGEQPFRMELEPDDRITFSGKQLTVEGHKLVTMSATLTNTTDERQTYKVKCTANSMFRIKPSMGFIEPKQTIKILLSFWGKTVPGNKEHYFSFYHMKCDEVGKKAREVWTEDSKPEGVRRLRIHFEIPSKSDSPPHAETAKAEEEGPVVLPAAEIKDGPTKPSRVDLGDVTGIPPSSESADPGDKQKRKPGGQPEAMSPKKVEAKTPPKANVKPTKHKKSAFEEMSEKFNWPKIPTTKQPAYRPYPKFKWPPLPKKAKSAAVVKGADTATPSTPVSPSSPPTADTPISPN